LTGLRDEQDFFLNHRDAEARRIIFLTGWGQKAKGIRRKVRSQESGGGGRDEERGARSGRKNKGNCVEMLLNSYIDRGRAKLYNWRESDADGC